MDNFLLVIISLFFLLTVASLTPFLARRTGFPHTVILFIIGVLMAIFNGIFPVFQDLATLHFSKDLVFFVFLPTLIFESAYNMPYKKLLRDILPIAGMAVLSLLLSSSVIGFFLKLILGFVGVDIPYAISFLFGAIISATDPVAVLSIFKQFGVPKRIMYLFEGESIFNDGTALALFLIIFEMIRTGSGFTLGGLSTSIITFFSMIIGGIILGAVMGFTFSKLIEYAKDSWAELTITLILAHTTFILAEVASTHLEVFKISGIIATAVAALVLGSYGRFKISRPVREMMDIIWGYFAFIANSLIFLLMGLMIGAVNFDVKLFLLPIVITIAVVALARIISIFGVMSFVNLFIKDKISKKWQQLLAWGSLRGAIAITMLLLIPADFAILGWELDYSPKEFLSVLVISCVVFTLIFKVLLVKGLIKKFKMTELSREENFTFHQLKEIIDKSILNRLKYLDEHKHVMKEVLNSLKSKYSQDIENENIALKKCHLKRDQFRSLLSRYALGVERRSIIEAFESKQIDEKTLKQTLNKIEEQFISLEMGRGQIGEQEEKEVFSYQLKEKFNIFFRKNRNEMEMFRRQYIFYRSRAIVAEEVIKQLQLFQKNFYSNELYHNCFDEIIDQYRQWLKNAAAKKFKIISEIKANSNLDIDKERSALLNNHLVYLEGKLIDKLYEKYIMNGKVKDILEKHIRR